MSERPTNAINHFVTCVTFRYFLTLLSPIEKTFYPLKSSNLKSSLYSVKAVSKQRTMVNPKGLSYNDVPF